MSIFDLFSSSSGEQAAAQAKRGAIQPVRKGAAQAAQDLTQYTGQAVSTAGQGLPNWQTIFGQGTAMSPYYMGGLGVGTPEQIAASGQAFQSSIPGQEFQALLPDIFESSLRRGGLTGQTGQVPIDLTNRAMQALNPFYQNWQSSLNPLPYETAGAAGQQGIYNTQAGLQAGLGTGLSSIDLQRAQAIANARSQYPKDVLAAQYGAGENTLSALFGLGELAMAPFTGGATLPGAFKSFGNIGGGGESAANMTGMYQTEPGVWADAFSNPAAGAFL